MQTLLLQEQKDLLLSEEHSPSWEAACDIHSKPKSSGLALGTRCKKGNFGAAGRATLAMQLSDITGGGATAFYKVLVSYYQSQCVLITQQLWKGLLIPGVGRDASLASLTQSICHPPRMLTLFRPTAFSEHPGLLQKGLHCRNRKAISFFFFFLMNTH